MEVDTTIEFGQGRSGVEGFRLKLQYEHSEVNVFVKFTELSLLHSVVDASWDERESIRIGECAGLPAFWSCDKETVTVLIGTDDECWDIAISMSTKAFVDLTEKVSIERPKFER